MLNQLQLEKCLKQKLKYLFIILVVIAMLPNSLYSQQTGSISGKITDKNTNEELIGANVLVVGTTIGSSTDIDGKYLIKGLTEGNYTIKISYVSYNSVTVQNIDVKSGENAKIDVSLESASTELDEVVVTAQALKNTEASVLKIQKNSANIVDGMSSELIKKNNSSDGADILKRMTGVTISEGKYAFVRGVGDRYNNTLLNGSSLPSTDPEKKSFSYDIIPANLIESVITAKTFTPDKPADFTGGLVQISTIEFPNKFTADVSLSSGFNNNTTLKDFQSYSGGKTDYLGIDDGTRDYPSLIGSEKVNKTYYSDEQRQAIASSFKNNWNISGTKAPINGGFKFTLGDKYDFSDQDIFGYIGSLSYSNSFTTTEKQNSFYDNDGSRYHYNGYNYNSNIVWNGMLNLAYKFSLNNKVSLKNIYNQNADNETSIFKGYYRYADQYRETTSLRFVSRSLLSSQLLGEHQFNFFNGLNIDWVFSYSRSERDEPDARRYIYWKPSETSTEPLLFLLDQSITTRYYANLVDYDYTSGINLNLKLFENPNMPKLKIGALYDKKDRDFGARTFGFLNYPSSYANEDSILQLPVQEIFVPENFNSKFIGVLEVTKLSDSYNSNQKVASGYFMFDTKIIEDIRLVAGARFEYSSQTINSYTVKNEPLSLNNIYRDWLPSINLSYALNQNINLRFAYSQTLARPEFRELAPFSYFDFIVNQLIEGNPDLKRTLINNYDLRFEMFSPGGGLVALSLFYKRFIDPIEQVLYSSTSNDPIQSFINANSARNYGIELELRKQLGFIADYLNNFSFVGNLSLIKSKVQFENKSINGESFQETERPLQGQADYIFNFGLYYDNYDFGLNSSIVYNKVGTRISKVGTSDVGNIIEKPVDLIDFSIAKKLFDSFSLKFAAKDLLNQERKFIQQAPGMDRISELNQTGRNFALELSYNIN